MPASRSVVLAALLFLGATVLRGAPVEADPHDLYTRASGDLSKGDLQAANAPLAQLHTVITSRPQWDPEGVFSSQLPPPLEARLKRLQRVAGQPHRARPRGLHDL